MSNAAGTVKHSDVTGSATMALPVASLTSVDRNGAVTDDNSNSDGHSSNMSESASPPSPSSTKSAFASHSEGNTTAGDPAAADTSLAGPAAVQAVGFESQGNPAPQLSDESLEANDKAIRDSPTFVPSSQTYYSDGLNPFEYQQLRKSHGKAVQSALKGCKNAGF